MDEQRLPNARHLARRSCSWLCLPGTDIFQCRLTSRAFTVLASRLSNLKRSLHYFCSYLTHKPLHSYRPVDLLAPSIYLTIHRHQSVFIMYLSKIGVVPSLFLGLVSSHQALGLTPANTTNNVAVVSTTCACATKPGTTLKQCFTTLSVDGPKPTGWQEEPCLCQPTDVEVVPGTWRQ